MRTSLPGTPVEALTRSAQAALDWRLLGWWTAGLLIPTAAAALPFWRELESLLDFSPRAADFAHQVDLLIVEDLSVSLSRVQPALMGAGGITVAIALVLSPWLTGMMMATASQEPALGRAPLLQSGLAWYGRALRAWLLSLVPLAILGMLASMLFKSAGDYAERALLETSAIRASRAAALGTTIVFVLVHAIVETARAELAANPRSRSVLRAFARAGKRVAVNPLAMLGLYLAPTVASLVVAALLVLIRLRIDGATSSGLVIGFVVTEMAVAVIGWGKASRLFALTALVRPIPKETDQPSDPPAVPSDEALSAEP
jgi:hypothetical protein